MVRWSGGQVVRWSGEVQVNVSGISNLNLSLTLVNVKLVQNNVHLKAYRIQNLKF